MLNITDNFYLRPTRQVAQDLLGKLLLRKYRGRLYLGLITETEAYCGPHDLASHACIDGSAGRRVSHGRTPRTEVMFGPPGRTYIYLIYGMYSCLNIVTEKEGYPAAVLIRATQAFRSIPANRPLTAKIISQLTLLPYDQTNGPGKLCRYFHLDKSLNNQPLTGPRLWVKDLGLKINKIKKLPRVGVDYAGSYKDKKWRFVFDDDLQNYFKPNHQR